MGEEMGDAAREYGNLGDAAELLCATCPAHDGEPHLNGDGELLRRCEELAARIAAHLERLQQTQRASGGGGGPGAPRTSGHGAAGGAGAATTDP